MGINRSGAQTPTEPNAGRGLLFQEPSDGPPSEKFRGWRRSSLASLSAADLAKPRGLIAPWGFAFSAMALFIRPNEFTQPEYDVTYRDEDGRALTVGRIFHGRAGVPKALP